MKVCIANAAGIGAAAMSGWTAIMPQDRRMKVARFRKHSDKALAVVSHRLLCYMLKTCRGITPREDQWGVGADGKPYLLDCDVHYNISHSGEMVMCALHDRPVGADIERMRPFSPNVPGRIMSPEEKRVYDLADDQRTLFFQIWTLKEAYIKYLGVGMRMPLHTITVYPAQERIESNISECRFSLLGGIPGYQAAVCADAPADAAEWIDEATLSYF
jgi:4'-phosphopantetheinyl transferase